MNSEKKDKELYELYLQQKNSKWLGLLLERYTLLLLGVCMKYLRNEEDAKDAVQSVFEKVINEIEKQRIDNFGGWLYRISVNECLMRLRKNKQSFTELTEKIGNIDADINISENRDKEEDLVFIEKHLTQLAREQKDCLERFYFFKQSYTKISELTGYTQNEVKSHIQNGKRNLRLMYIKKKHND
jgi:RNA polymerase sigma-70 factor (ECF subfamily)